MWVNLCVCLYPLVQTGQREHSWCLAALKRSPVEWYISGLVNRLLSSLPNVAGFRLGNTSISKKCLDFWLNNGKTFLLAVGLLVTLHADAPTGGKNIVAHPKVYSLLYRALHTICRNFNSSRFRHWGTHWWTLILRFIVRFVCLVELDLPWRAQIHEEAHRNSNSGPLSSGVCAQD